jgi:hypothetical protein
MAVMAGKPTGKNESSFAALKSRLAEGRGKMAKAAADSFRNKTSWSKGATRIGKGTFKVSGATPGVKKRGV